MKYHVTSQWGLRSDTHPYFLHNVKKSMNFKFKIVLITCRLHAGDWGPIPGQERPNLLKQVMHDSLATGVSVTYGSSVCFMIYLVSVHEHILLVKGVSLALRWCRHMVKVVYYFMKQDSCLTKYWHSKVYGPILRLVINA